MENVYIKAMEIGFKNPNGIKYFDLKKQIEDTTSIVFDATLESTFIKWVGECFDSTYSTTRQLDDEIKRAIPYIRQGDGVDLNYKNSYDGFSFRTWVMKGSTVKQYLDYIELKEARKNAKQATGLSIFSIFVAVAAILIGAFQNVGSPKPPYDVKVIEDMTRTTELESEIKQLKEDCKNETDSLKGQIYKAKLLINTYESKPVKKKKTK